MGWSSCAVCRDILQVAKCIGIGDLVDSKKLKHTEQKVLGDCWTGSNPDVVPSKDMQRLLDALDHQKQFKGRHLVYNVLIRNLDQIAELFAS